VLPVVEPDDGVGHAVASPKMSSWRGISTATGSPNSEPASCRIRSSESLAYVSFNSTPIPERPSRDATMSVVPEPRNGSSTTHGTGSAGGQVQDGAQPVVRAVGSPKLRFGPLGADVPERAHHVHLYALHPRVQANGRPLDYLPRLSDGSMCRLRKNLRQRADGTGGPILLP
jgi:hypothetical protein